MTMKKKRILGAVLAASLAVAGAYVIYGRVTRGASAGPSAGRPSPGAPGAGAPMRNGAPVAVEVSPVENSPVRELGVFSGSLQPRSRFVLSTRVAGRLVRVNADVGDGVARGETVAVLDDKEYAAQYEQSRADLEVMQATLEDAGSSLETARRDLERARTLFEGKIASQTELDSAATALRKAETQHRVVQAQRKQKEAALETVKDRLEATRLVAEWEGGSEVRVVGERFADPGALLRANDPVVSILDIGALTATVNVTEAMYIRMRPGLPARAVTDAIPGAVFDGRVERVAPFLNETSRQAEVRIEIPNPQGRLKPGMFVRVTLEFGRREGAVTVPAAALIKRGEQEGVFRLADDGKTVSFIPVRTGITDSGRVEILEPPLSGRVVVLGHHLLQDGSAVFLPGSPGRGGGL